MCQNTRVCCAPPSVILVLILIAASFRPCSCKGFCLPTHSSCMPALSFKLSLNFETWKFFVTLVFYIANHLRYHMACGEVFGWYRNLPDKMVLVGCLLLQCLPCPFWTDVPSNYCKSKFLITDIFICYCRHKLPQLEVPALKMRLILPKFNNLEV